MPQQQRLRIYLSRSRVNKHFTKLTIQLRRLEVGNEAPLALFYDYSTMEVPYGNGFSINSGLGTLSCQVSGMKLDYFGPPKSQLVD